MAEFLRNKGLEKKKDGSGSSDEGDTEQRQEMTSVERY